MNLDEQRQYGKTDIAVSILGFGGNVLGNLYDVVEEEAALDTVAAAYDSDIRYFDTAPVYGHGLSEHRIGFVLRRYPRDSFVLSTKVGRLLKPHGRVAPPRLPAHLGGIFEGELPFEVVLDYTYDAVMRSFEDSLQRLGTHRVDIALIHDVDTYTHRDQIEARREDVRRGALPALQKLRDEGAIRAFGAGVNEWEACDALMDIGDFDGFLLAHRYTLIEQEPLDTFLPRCAEANVAVTIGAPFSTGILVTGATADARYNYQPAPEAVKSRVAAIERVCGSHGVRLGAAALQFPLGHPAVVNVIPGSRSRAEVLANAALMAEPIPEAFWADLKAEKLLRSDAPTPVGV